MGFKLKFNFPAIGKDLAKKRKETAQTSTLKKRVKQTSAELSKKVIAEASAIAVQEHPSLTRARARGPVKLCWVLDISDPSRFKHINIADNEKYPDGVLSASLIRRSGWGGGPKAFATRMPVKHDGNGHTPTYEFVDLYDYGPFRSGAIETAAPVTGQIGARISTKTPANLYVAVMQPELRRIIQSKPSIWHRVQTGLYVTALIVLAVVVALIIVILLGD